MLTRLARWWLTRHDRPTEPDTAVRAGECICGKTVTGDDLHLVVAHSTNDEALGIEGHTAMSADFCADHCPGGCQQHCVPSTP